MSQSPKYRLGGIIDIKELKDHCLLLKPILKQYRLQIEMVKGKQKEHFEEDWLITEFIFMHFLNKFHLTNQVP
jgi:hypothetical protein